MYEDITFESILKRMLSKVPSTFDKREGSIIYDALAPSAIELQLMYIELDFILKETFGDTASREFLIRRASERGIRPEPASYALLKGEFNVDVPLGARFSCYDLNYIVTEKIEDRVYKLQCETVGVVGNKNFGTMIPIDYVEALESAELTELLIPGEEEEDTESIRTRYFNSFDVIAYGGNVQDYLDKTNSISGVGATKVTPVWKGGGTVLVTIINSEFSAASEVLVDLVQDILDPTKDSKGLGVAPIGHIVTVNTVEEVGIDINTKIIFDIGYNFEQFESSIIEVIEEYLLSIRQEWATRSNSVVRIAEIETRIMGIDGVIDIGDTKINGVASNLTLNKYQVPVLGGVLND